MDTNKFIYSEIIIIVSTTKPNFVNLIYVLHEYSNIFYFMNPTNFLFNLNFINYVLNDINFIVNNKTCLILQ